MAYFEIRNEFDTKVKGTGLSQQAMDIMNLKGAFLSDYKSHYKELPRDPEDSFMEDIIEYANHEPLYLLALGKPKMGTTTLCKQLA
mmetsp:Transcript_186/g.166  ORF Transcript_186/g.166 Transcript_186/m.166 type:complete len:86 (+) Transcript_186:1254-1511(+)